MEILVINEPFTRDFCRTQRWAARTRGRVLRAPDWLAYATAVLEKKYPGKVKLYDFPALDWGREEYIRLVRQEKPSWIILDSTTPSIHSDIGYARLAKEYVPTVKIIMVGPHASALPQETLETAGPSVDFIAIGEYDYTVRDVIENYRDPAGVAGIAYWANGKVQITVPRQPIEDLDQLPFPAWQHLDLMKYFDGGKLHPYIDIISGRGCPNRCTFCLWPQVMHGFKYRLRSPHNVVDEIERDIKLCPKVAGTGEFFFEDDTFTVNKKRALDICREIITRGLKIRFSVNARVDTADGELFALMKKAGCRELLVGFESGDQGILDRVHKGITPEQGKAFVKLAKKNGLDVHGCFVIGLPGETRATAEKTIKYALSLGLHTAQFSGAVPFPGTKYFEYCESENLLLTRDWRKWLLGGEQKGVVDYPGLSAREIDELVDSALRRFYFRPSYLLRFALETKSLPDLYRKVRGAFNFFGYLSEKVRRKETDGTKYTAAG
jgi:anaerobic magnesium-protoporphyrin IX monomethyl ester cyclase